MKCSTCKRCPGIACNMKRCVALETHWAILLSNEMAQTEKQCARSSVRERGRIAICDVAGKHQVEYCSKTAMLTIAFCDDSDGQHRGGYCQAASRRRNADSGAIKPNNTAQPTRRNAVAGPHAAGALACARSGCKRNVLQGSTAREPQHVRRCAKWLGDLTRVPTVHFGPAPPMNCELMLFSSCCLTSSLKPFLGGPRRVALAIVAACSPGEESVR